MNPNNFIVRDEKEYLKRVRKELTKKIKQLIKRGIRVVRSHGDLVDVISKKGEKLSSKEEQQILILAERLLELHKREKKLKIKEEKTWQKKKNQTGKRKTKG